MKPTGKGTKRFHRGDRLRSKGRFDAVFRDCRLFRFREMTLRILPNGLGHSRLGIVVGRRHGNAVRRNRMKRLLREAFRLNRGMLSVPCDVVIVPRTAWRELFLGEIEPVLRKALDSANAAFADG